MATAVIWKKKLQSYLFNTAGFYSSQIMYMPACNTYERSVKGKNSMRFNL